MNENFIITIGRQFGSRGKEVGQALAKHFGIAFYDKELLTLASKASGLCPEFFEKADERNSGSILQAFAAGFTFGSFQYNDFLSNDKLFQIQSDVIRRVADESSCVIVGRCADYILRDHPRRVDIFVHADLEQRVQTVMNRQHITEQEALADEVRHPLNEFVLAWVDYGVATPCLLALCFAVAVYRLGKRKEGFSPTLACSLSALFVFACFSYPSKYPLAWQVAALALASLARRHLPVKKRSRFWRVFPVASWTAAATLLVGLGVEFHYERTWSRAARRCLYGHSERMMPVYARLHRHYARNPYFLYNYAAEQFYAGRFAPALATAKECRAYWSSYNLELLTGDICRHLGRHEEAIAHYRQAGHMCPVRFAPLEGLYHAYKASGQADKADSISAVIRRKKAKVLSPEVARIKKNF